jgi:hypothetical protein
MAAMIAGAISTAATNHGPSQPSHQTILATGAQWRESREAPAARRGAAGPTR